MEQGDHMVGGERGDQSGGTHGSVGGWGARGTHGMGGYC